jgi:glycosyltransferase involved in cell wall biosynthesis
MTEILILLNNFNAGGAERVAINLANHFDSVPGFKIKVITDSFSGPLRSDLNKNIEIFQKSEFKIKNASYRTIVFSPMRAISMKYLFLIMQLRIYRKATLVCREANLFNNERENLSLTRKLYFWVLLRFTYSWASFLICNSEDTKKDVEILKVISKRKIYQIPNPVLTRSQGKAQSKTIFKQRPLNVVTVGRLHPQKDHTTLLKAFSQLQSYFASATLTIVGTGEQEPIIRGEIAKLQLNNVRLLPYVNDVPKFLSNYEVFVLTSRFEGFGNVLVEALHAGCLIVATDCPGGPREILSSYKGAELVPVSDPIAVSTSIRRLFLNTAEVNVRDLEDYTVEAYAKKLVSLLI